MNVQMMRAIAASRVSTATVTAGLLLVTVSGAAAQQYTPPPVYVPPPAYAPPPAATEPCRDALSERQACAHDGRAMPQP